MEILGCEKKSFETISAESVSKFGFFVIEDDFTVFEDPLHIVMSSRERVVIAGSFGGRVGVQHGAF